MFHSIRYNCTWYTIIYVYASNAKFANIDDISVFVVKEHHVFELDAWCFLNSAKGQFVLESLKTVLAVW